jgi:hypothetical protein
MGGTLRRNRDFGHDVAAAMEPDSDLLLSIVDGTDSMR